jgi:class 3 adenylate cyclase
MKWNFQRSKDRLAGEWARIQEAGLNIQRLTREMDLSNLSPTDTRIVHGCHIYCHIANFGELIDSPLLRQDEFRRLHRLLHIIRVEQRHTLQQIFGGDKIQVQGPKFHGLIYKPYDDDPALAWKSVLAAVALNLISRYAIPLVFPNYPALIPATGVAIGDCLVANIGPRAERELISVGRAANYAAKILEENNAVTVDSELWLKLAEEHQELFFKVGDVYVLDESLIGDPEQLLKDQSYTWTIEQSAARMETTCDDLPLAEINSSAAQVEVDFSQLGPRTIKTCTGASLFVDIDKYTATIDALLGDEDQLGKAVQWLHLFRYEVRHVTVDQNAVPVQHQGDRLQALSHLPFDDESAAMRKAVEICIDYNSSMEEVLNVYHADLGKLYVAIGASFGKTVALRSGVRGDMDAGCLSKAIKEAEHWQIASSGGEISISSRMYDALDDEAIRDQFHFNEARSCYTAKDLTWTKVADLRKSRNYASKEPVGFNKENSAIVFGITASQSREVLPLKQTRPWGFNE